MCWPSSDEFEQKTATRVLKFIKDNMLEEEALVNEGGGIRLVKALVGHKEDSGCVVDFSSVLPQLDPALSEEYVAYKDDAVSFFPCSSCASISLPSCEGERRSSGRVYGERTRSRYRNG